MKSKSMAVAALLALAAQYSVAADPAADATLIEDGKVKVDATDFHASMLRVPEDRRIDLRTSYDRIAGMVDGIFITRTLAERARAEGIDQDPAVQRRMQQAGEAVLADMYRAKIARETAAMNLEPRARELYRADPSKFRTDDQVHVQHVLVNLQGRTREQAQARAKMVAEKARGEPAEFLAFAQQYSDDPEKRGNRGDLGFTSPKSLSEGIRNAIATMKPGDISDPVETEHGFHIVKFIARKAGEQLPFEMVKDSIIRAELARIQKARVDQLVNQIRASSTVTVNTNNVEKLVVPLPADMTGGVKAPEQAAKK